ncbi:hypothetical protein INT43_000767 [Umbelopsis isabellina]|uniref:HORMA domain-containing protein n=1 Tax=Mortierella isabellina TaxID=91625 RepID=A0A8H7UN29_MORIS|nr:hypothetical protein INT43_000767 [Umbelopsis isabellina]
MSRHPDINRYINHVVEACKKDMPKEAIQSVAVVIIDAQQKPIERYVFDLNAVFHMSPHQFPDSIITYVATVAQILEMHLPDLEIQMRGFLLRISAAQALLQPLPGNCTFSLTVDTKQPMNPDSEQEAKTGVSPWIPAEEFQKPEAFRNSNLIPLKSLNTGAIQLSLFVQEVESG